VGGAGPGLIGGLGLAGVGIGLAGVGIGLAGVGIGLAGVGSDWPALVAAIPSGIVHRGLWAEPIRLSRSG
jgi:hypothetical protein